MWRSSSSITKIVWHLAWKGMFCISFLQFSFQEIGTSFQDWMLLCKEQARNLRCQFISFSPMHMKYQSLNLANKAAILSAYCRNSDLPPLGSCGEIGISFIIPVNENSMKMGFWNKMLSIFSLTSKSTHRSRSRPRSSLYLKNNTNWKLSPAILLANSVFCSGWSFHLLRELDFCFLHRSFSHTSDGIWESVNFCSVHFRQFSVEKTICLTTLLFSLHFWHEIQTSRNFPPLSGDKTSVQEDSSCLQTTENHNCSFFPKSSDHPHSATWFSYVWCLLTPKLVNVLVCVVTWGIAWVVPKTVQKKSLREKLWTSFDL